MQVLTPGMCRCFAVDVVRRVLCGLSASSVRVLVLLVVWWFSACTKHPESFRRIIIYVAVEIRSGEWWSTGREKKCTHQDVLLSYIYSHIRMFMFTDCIRAYFHIYELLRVPDGIYYTI